MCFDLLIVLVIIFEIWFMSLSKMLLCEDFVIFIWNWKLVFLLVFLFLMFFVILFN